MRRALRVLYIVPGASGRRRFESAEPSSGRPLFVAFVVALLLCGIAGRASAQKYQNLGRGKCVNCHDHDNEKLWSEKKDGPPPNNHLNALKQMESPKSKGFAEATGVKDVYDVGSPCVRCHATVVKGDVSGGITCESCHGPGSGYLEPHQKKDGGYEKALAVGMNDFVKKSDSWAGACMKCHVMDDARLIAAKHPSGDDFDLGAKFAVVATGHWKSTYDKAAISAAGKRAAAPLLAARKGGSPAAVVAAATPPPPPPPTPAVPSVSAPSPAGPPSAPVAPKLSTSPAPSTTSMPPVAAQPVAPPPASRPTPSPGRADRPTTSVAAPPPRAPTPTPSPGLPPSPASAPSPPPMPADPTPVVPPAVGLPQSPAAAVAEIQGQAIALLDSLLRRGGRAPVRVVPPERKTQYRGADAELLRLQEEVLALAIEALGTAPVPADAKQPAAR